MGSMDHSIAAKYAARPAAQFVRASARARERRMGLVVGLGLPPGGHRRDRPAPPRRGAADEPARPLALDPARPARVHRSGRPHHAVVMHWTRSERAAATRRPSAASAPWRG